MPGNLQKGIYELWKKYGKSKAYHTTKLNGQCQAETLFIFRVDAQNTNLLQGYFYLELVLNLMFINLRIKSKGGF